MFIPDSRVNQFGIIQVLQSSHIPQTSNWSGTFFDVSYSKPALRAYCSNIHTVQEKLPYPQA
jgi:hypothetical protein